MKKIYIADDDPAILDATKMMLELDGYEVETSIDGTIVTLMTENPPHLLLLDILMSGLDGKDICRTLKAQKSTKHVPIIMISASRDVEEGARDAGADDFISKPFEMNFLLSKIKEHII